MKFDYTIKYISEKIYDNPVYEAFWQYMVTPENNDTQELIACNYNTSVNAKVEHSISGFNFETARVHCKEPFNDFIFSAEFKLVKKEINPFEFVPSADPESDYDLIESHDFKIEFEAYLSQTTLTSLPDKFKTIYPFDLTKSLIENLMLLNSWVYMHLYFKTGVTHVGSLLEEIIENRHGVCQDFSHLFIAITRQNNLPARYVSGYLHQGDGFFGDSQMHAWVEVFVPTIGWLGFDPTNNILANHNHIKVSHGRDYNDCAPLKGVVYSTGENQTKYAVEVTYEQ